MLQQSEMNNHSGPSVHRWGPVFLYLILLLVPSPVLGDMTTVTPSVSLRQTWNDNIFLDTEDPVADWVTNVSPQLVWSNKTERLGMDLSAELNWIEYAETDDLNDMEQDYAADIDWQWTPVLHLAASAGYVRTTSRDRDIDTSGLVILSNTTRDSLYMNGSANYSLSELSMADLNYTFQQVAYDDDVVSNVKIHVVTGSFTRHIGRFLELTTGTMNLQYARYDYDKAGYDVYSTTLGFSRKINEILTLTMDAGVSYTRSEYTVQAIEWLSPFYYILRSRQETDTAWGEVGHLGLTFKGQASRFKLDFSHDVKDGGSRGSTTTRTEVGADFNRRLTHSLQVGINTAFFHNHSDRATTSNSDIKEDTWRIKPRIRYNITQNWSMETAYQYLYLKDHIDDTTAQRNLFEFRLSYRWPLTW